MVGTVQRMKEIHNQNTSIRLGGSKKVNTASSVRMKNMSRAENWSSQDRETDNLLDAEMGTDEQQMVQHREERPSYGILHVLVGRFYDVKIWRQTSIFDVGRQIGYKMTMGVYIYAFP